MLAAPLTHDSSRQILCFYANRTSQTQVVRISNIPDYYFERVMFPGRSLLFHAAPQAVIEIHTFTSVSTIHTDTIPCTTLQVGDELITNLLSRLS